MKEQQSLYPFLQFIKHFQVAARSTSPDMTNVFCARLYGRFIEIETSEKETSYIKLRLQFSWR